MYENPEFYLIKIYEKVPKIYHLVPRRGNSLPCVSLKRDFHNRFLTSSRKLNTGNFQLHFSKIMSRIKLTLHK